MNMTVFLCAVIIVLAGILLWMFLDKRKQQKQIASLSAYLSKVQDNNEIPKIDEAYEGDLHILQSEIYKTANMLQMEFASEQEKNKLLNELLTNVSHQIKTPLTALTIMCDNLEKENLSEREKQICLRRIRQQTDHIRTLIRNLLVSSEIDAGVFIMRKEETPLYDLIERSAEPLKALMEIRDIDFMTDIPREITIKADGSWFSEAVSNIFKNCIEHTPSGGGITVTASSNNLYADLLIKDTGEGMDEVTKQHMFERFYKGSGNPDSNGIGMYLAKQIIQLHDGTIDVESRPQEGTSFHIRLYFYENRPADENPDSSQE